MMTKVLNLVKHFHLTRSRLNSLRNVCPTKLQVLIDNFCKMSRHGKCCRYGRYICVKNIGVARVAGLGRLSAGAKMAMKPFVKRVITIFATNASFLRVI